MTETSCQAIGDYISAVAARKSTPGGGSVAACSAANACALLAMVANFTRTDLSDISRRAESSAQQLLSLADQDEIAFNRVMSAYKGDGELEEALRQAATVPGDVIQIIRSHLPDMELLRSGGNQNLITDVAIAASLFRAALESCRLNVLVNTTSMNDKGTSFDFDVQQLQTDIEACNEVTSAILKGFR